MIEHDLIPVIEHFLNTVPKKAANLRGKNILQSFPDKIAAVGHTELLHTVIAVQKGSIPSNKIDVVRRCLRQGVELGLAPVAIGLDAFNAPQFTPKPGILPAQAHCAFTHQVFNAVPFGTGLVEVSGQRPQLTAGSGNLPLLGRDLIQVSLQSTFTLKACAIQQ
jgi:hypothetical protein